MIATTTNSSLSVKALLSACPTRTGHREGLSFLADDRRTLAWKYILAST